MSDLLNNKINEIYQAVEFIMKNASNYHIEDLSILDEILRLVKNDKVEDLILLHKNNNHVNEGSSADRSVWDIVIKSTPNSVQFGSLFYDLDDIFNPIDQ